MSKDVRPCSPAAVGASQPPAPLADSRLLRSRTMPRSSSATFISKHRATRRRRGTSTARCSISIRSGTARRKEIFEDALKADPECGIAYWGIALSLLWNPHVPPPAKNLAEGAAAIAKGKSVGAKTQRERDYIDALAVMYADHDKVDHRARVLAYLEGDGAAGAALSERRRGADPLRARAQHRGLAHRQDLRQPAQGRGDPGADLQAPAAASRRRALPDPSLRLPGDRRERARCGQALRQDRARRRRTRSTCRRTSSRASATGRNRSPPTRKRSASRKQSKDFHDQLHAMDYLVYAYLQLGQDKDAKAVLDEMTTVAGFTETFLPGPYALAVSPARYAVERGDWKAAAELAGPSEPARARAGDDAFRARARRGPLGQSRSRQGGHRQARRAARQAARGQGRLLVASRSISSGRSPPPGCSMPRASTTTRSRP